MRLKILVMSLALAGPTVAAEHPSHGYWLTENGNAIVKFEPCGQKVCGQMVWVANARDAAGDLKRDVKNEDPTARARAICGLPLLGGLDSVKENRLEDGWIYNPRDGETYSVEVELVSVSEMKVRGFLGISLLGSSQVWTRVGDDRGGC